MRRRNRIPSRFRYASVRLCCVHYGQPRIRSTGVRPNQRYLALGCEAFISVKFDTIKIKLCVSSYHLVHTGHVLDPECLRFYARRRQLNQDERQKVEELVKLQAGNKQLKDYIERSFNKTVTLSDIRNVKSRLKRGGDKVDALCETVTEELPRTLSYNEKCHLLSDQFYQLQQAVLHSGTASFMRRLDWLQRQTLCWQQGLDYDMEHLVEGAEPNNLPNNCPEAPSDGRGPEVDISCMPQSMDAERPIPRPNELMDHTYNCLFTAALPPPPGAFPCCPVTSVQSITLPMDTHIQSPVSALITAVHMDTPSSVSPSTLETTRQSLVRLPDCQLLPIKQRGCPKGSSAWGTSSKQRLSTKRNNHAVPSGSMHV
ncbi:uncharacterized protein [Heterodontus francisci]|uniref:uncharacterized protein n=1 Tax=Heterodontus francisci TaxID=7792 RepID=UPI00355AD112